MALLNRLNRMARTIGDFANEALESTREARETNRSSSAIDANRAAVEEQYRIIGEHYYNIYANGGEIAEEVIEACEAAKDHLDAIAAAEEEERLRREEEERIRREEELAARQEQSGTICPECGAEVAPGKRFCGECGTKLETEAPKTRTCPECGTEVEPGKRFCGECGYRMDE